MALDVIIRPATRSDIPSITACVHDAYAHYVERIGKKPGPMLDDFEDTVARCAVHVAIAGSDIVGVVVLKVTDEGFYLDNIAVRPSAQGSGVGRLLLELVEAEARRQGFPSIYLATHELMTENRALYARIGYVEYDHRVVAGYPRVFMRKRLA
jgi:N-acetylglutamate synthase-like GNAT family acetyltransferase